MRRTSTYSETGACAGGASRAGGPCAGGPSAITSDIFSFSTAGLPDRERFPAFADGLVRVMLNLQVEQSGPNPFFGQVEAMALGDVTFSVVRSSPADYVRTTELVRDGHDSLFAVIPSKGALYTTQGENGPMSIPSGALAICDSTQVGGLRLASDTEYFAIEMPRARLASLLPGVRKFGGLHGQAGDAPAALMTAYLKLLRDPAAGIFARPTAKKIIAQHLVDLVALALGAGGEHQELIEARTSRSARRAAIFQEIERRLSDPGLNAASVATALGISPRYVHLLLDEAGRTFSQYVLDKRLDRIRGRLQDPGEAKAMIADIAYSEGFVDLSYFNRTFRRRFGATPSSVRLASAQKSWIARAATALLLPIALRIADLPLPL